VCAARPRDSPTRATETDETGAPAYADLAPSGVDVDGAPVDERTGAMVRLAKEAYMTPRASA